MIERNGEQYYKLGLHIHTTLSDGQKTPEQVVQLYKENGYDAIALTDHWVYSGGGEQEGLLILSGCEYNNRGSDSIAGILHLVGLGMAYDPQLPKDADGQQIIEAVRAAGGMVVLAHPAWSLNTLEQARQLQGVEASEIYNAVSEANQSIRAYSNHFMDVCANAGIYYRQLATDDAHYYNGIDACKGWVMVRAEQRSREALLSALRRGDSYATQGPELYVCREGDRLIVDCSPCSYIAVVSNLTWCKDRVLRGQGLTHHEYTIGATERWIRVEVCDEHGKFAWSNILEV